MSDCERAGAPPRESGPLTPTDDGADEACIRDGFTGDVSGVVDFDSELCDELSLTYINQDMHTVTGLNL